MNNTWLRKGLIVSPCLTWILFVMISTVPQLSGFLKQATSIHPLYLLEILVSLLLVVMFLVPLLKKDKFTFPYFLSFLLQGLLLLALLFLTMIGQLVG